MRKTDRRDRRKAMRRGIYILPTLFTVGNIFFGYWSVVKVFQAEFSQAALLLFLAAFCDAIDGRIARMTKTTTEFGEQYDSLADVVSFGFAPAMLAWQWGMPDLQRWGFLAAFVFLVCGSMRLARFNIMISRVDKRWFVGLPIPAGAGVIAAIVNFHPEPLPPDPVWQISWAVLVVTVSLLMVSTFRFRSFKDVDTKRHPMSILVMVAILIVLVAEPRITLAAGIVLYALSGPIGKLASLRTRAGTEPTEQETPDAEEPA